MSEVMYQLSAELISCRSQRPKVPPVKNMTQTWIFMGIGEASSAISFNFGRQANTFCAHFQKQFRKSIACIGLRIVSSVQRVWPQYGSEYVVQDRA